MSSLDTVLRDFLSGTADAAELAQCLADEGPLPSGREVNIDGDFRVQVAHVAKISQCAVDGVIPIEGLQTLALTLTTSGTFTWNDLLVSEMLRHWIHESATMPQLKGALAVLNRRLRAEETVGAT